jgi:hypothetical protein
MATYFRLLDVGRQFFDGNGDPLSGGKLYTYDAGTTTDKTTYQDDAGAASHANPIVCDSAGRLTAEVWGTTGAYKFKLNDSLDSTLWTRDDITGINDAVAATASEWVTHSGTATYVSATTFTVTGDQASIFHIGRRLKLTDTGTLYATITGSTGTPTTVTVVVDGATALTAALTGSYPQYGLISAVNPSVSDALVRLASKTEATVASVGFANLLATYRAYLLVFSDLVPATDNVELWIRVDQNNGASFDAGASDYSWTTTVMANNAATNVSDESDTEISLTATGTADNAAASEIAGNIWIMDPMNTGTITQVIWDICGQSQAAVFDRWAGAGQYKAAAAATNAFQVLFSSGNIATINWTLYGVRA